jgi:hypothetical protein
VKPLNTLTMDKRLKRCCEDSHLMQAEPMVSDFLVEEVMVA